MAQIASTGRTVFHDVLGIVLPHAGVRLVPGYFCLILGRVVSKGGRIVYRFDRLDSGLIASFQKRFNATVVFLSSAIFLIRRLLYKKSYNINLSLQPRLI